MKQIFWCSLEFCLKQIWYLNNIQRSPDDAISKSLNIKLTATLSLNSFFSMSSKISKALKNNWNLETKAIVQTFANNVNKIQWRRMHSSRMRTIHCSGHLWGGGVCPGVSVQGGVCPGGICQGGVCSGGVWLAGVVSVNRGMYTYPQWTDRHLWKHNLSASTVADGN